MSQDDPRWGGRYALAQLAANHGALPTVGPHSPTSIFLFRTGDRCECGRALVECYVELPNGTPYAARRKMVELRGGEWSHELNGPLSAFLASDPELEDPHWVRATHAKIAANGPDVPRCFCGEQAR